MFGSSVIAALDHDGKEVWRSEIKPYKFDVAVAASPVLFGDTVILQCDQVEKQSRIIALDKKTGDVKWRRFAPLTASRTVRRSSLRLTGKKQLLVAASNAVQGLDPANGKVLWTCNRQRRHGFPSVRRRVSLPRQRARWNWYRG